MMRWLKTGAAVLLLGLFAAGLLSRLPDAAYHTAGLSPQPAADGDWPTCRDDCRPDAVLQHRSNPQLPPEDDQGYLMGFVEFDDQGWLHDPRQLDVIGEHLLSRSRDADTRYLMVVFAHGWQHNARMDDGNVQSFRQLLEHVDRDEMLVARLTAQTARPYKRRKVVGVYLGWRGRTVDLPVLEYATFWTRKAAAARVGDGGAQEVLLRLNQMRALLNGKGDDHLAGPDETQLVIIGHSFGGLLVDRALHTQITERAFRTSRGKVSGVANSFGDLVVLVNPAFEGAIHETLNRVARQRDYGPTQRPVMMIVTSVTDLATGLAFPAGRIFTWLQSAPQPGERPAVLETVGHLDRYRTHRLTWQPEGDCRLALAAADARARAARQLSELPGTPGIMEVAERHYGCAHLAAVDPAAKRVPYLVVSADKEVIDGHNDISNPHFIDFVRIFLWREVTSPAAYLGVGG